MYNHILYLLYWAINAVVLFFLNWLLPQQIILGNSRLIPIEAAIYAGFWLTFFVWSMWDLVIGNKIKLDSEGLNFLYFLLVNIVGAWVVSRFTKFSGLEIDSFVWVLVVALVGNLIQRQAWLWVVRRKIY